MTIKEAIKEIEEDGINLGAGDFVSVDALKVAVDVMKDYQIIQNINKRLEQENKIAFKELESLRRIVIEHISLAPLTMNVTITKEQAESLGILPKMDGE